MQSAEDLVLRLIHTLDKADGARLGAAVIEEDRAEMALAVLEEVVDLGIELMKAAAADERLDEMSRLSQLSGGCFAEAIRKTKEKYRK